MFLLGSTIHISAQEKFILSGKVLDQNSEPLFGASIWIEEVENGTTSDINGHFNYPLSKGQYTIKISYIGFEDKIETIKIKNNQQLTFQLDEGVSLETITIKSINSKAKDNLENPYSGYIKMEQKDIESLPAILGETDVIKTIQLLPGVQSGNESSAGLYVRGGNTDQNLILLDGAPIYNPTHAAGFISAFNTDIIKSFEIYKGAFPAQYGNRLSSVLDIETRTGNKEKLTAEGGLGLLTGRLNLEGPIFNKKASFIVAARSFYSYSLARSILPKNIKADLPKYFFYDLYGKLDFKISDKDNFSISGFSGGDIVNFSQKDDGETTTVNIPWYNHMVSSTWRRKFKDEIFGYLQSYYSRYNFSFKLEDIYSTDIAEASIKDIGLKYFVNFYPSKNHKVRTGIDLNYIVVRPEIKKGLDEFNDSTGEYSRVINEQVVGRDRKSLLHSIYLNHDWKIHPRLDASYGIRLTYNIANNENFLSADPKIAINAKLHRQVSLKFGYSYISQYAHILSNSSVSTPFDIWISSSDRVPVQRAHETSLGVSTNFLKDILIVNVTGYYKKMSGQVGYLPGENLFNHEGEIEDILTTGDGTAYGIEFNFKKEQGKWQGFIAYTLAWANRKFDLHNNGVKYPAQFDRRNDLALSLNYNINDKWSIYGLFIFGSGYALTLPTGKFFDPTKNGWNNPQQITQFTGKNTYRLSPYHRMDIGAKYTIKKEKINHILRFDIYNLYNKANPFIVLPTNTVNENEITYKVIEYSIIPTLPSISWHFELK